MGFITKNLGKVTGSEQAAKAAQAAAGTQAQMAERGIEEQRRQFDALTELLRPYVEAGTPALQEQQAFLGLRGPESQQTAISALEQSPLFQSQVRQGEEALLQQASATGGLRGGNIQAALAQFRPQMLQQQIANQYANLGGMTVLGQKSAAGQAAAGMESAGGIADLLAQRGAAIAGGQLAKGGERRQLFGDLLSIGSMAAGAFGGGGAGMGGAAAQPTGGMGGGTGLRMPRF